MNSNDIRIDVYLAGADKAIASMRTLQENANKFSRKTLKKKIEIETKNAQKSIDTINKKLLALEKERLNARKELLNMPKGEGGALRKYIQEITLKMQELRLKTREVKAEMQGFKQIDITPRLDWGFFTRVSSVVRNIGSSMLSLSGAIGRITAPLDMLTRGTLYSAAFTGLNKITEGLSGSFERYDIMHTYPKIMESMGSSTTEAKKAIDELYQSVLGLPTGLDTIVEAQKQYYLATGDMTKATKMAIAANNAFVAGGADDVQILQGQRQLRDLMSAGKLKVSEWESLAKAMPSAFNAIQEDLHVTRKDIMSGQVSAEKFVGSLLKVATGTGKVAQAAEEMKHTFTAVGANIRNSLRDAGVQALEALDETLKNYDGGDVIDHLLKIKPAIQEMRDSIIAWIKANPDKIIEFFNKLKQIDIMGIVKGMGKGLAPLFKFFGGVFSLLQKYGKGGESFGKFFIQLHIFGKVLGAVGGLVKGSAPLWGFTAMMGRFFKTTEAWSKLAKVNAVEKVIKFLNRFKKVEKGVKAVEGAEAAAAGAAGATASVGTLLTNLLGAVTPAIAIAAYAGAFALVGKTITSFAKSLKEVSEIKINSWSNLYTNLLNITAIIGALGGIAAALGTATTNPLGAIGALEMAVGGGEILGLTYLAKQIASSMDALATVKVPTNDKLDKIKDALSRIGELYAEIDTGSFWKALSRRLRSGQDNKYLKNIESMTETVSGILQTSQNLITKISDLSKTKNLAEDINAVRPRLQKLGTFIHDIYVIMQDVVNGDFGTKGVGAGAAYHEERIDIKGATKKFEQMASYIAQIDSVLSGLENIPKHISRIHTKLNNVKNSKAAGGKGKIETDAIAEDIKNIVGIVKAIVDDGKLDELKSVTERLQGINVDAITQPLDKIPTLLKKLQSLRDYFGKNGTKWLTPSGSKTDKQQLKMGGGLDGLMSTSPTYDGKAQSMLESISHIVDFLKQIASKLEQVPDLSEKATTLHTGVTALYNAYKRFTGFSNYVAKNPVNSEGIKQNISKIVTDTIGALAGAPLMYTYSLAFKAAVANVTKSLKSVTNGKSGSVFAFINGLKKIPAQLQAVSNAMKGKGAYWKSQLVNGFKGAKDDILTAIQNISLAIAQGDYTSNFYQAGANAGASYSNGFNNSINLNTPNGTTTTTKTTKKKHKRSFGDRISNWVNNLFANTGGYISKDGVLYRANGGEVFQPRGTDTIPAMLSEGEYVMQRKATSAFGTKFMQRINNLDLGGAIMALGMRGGQLAYATPTVNIDNSKHVTYNNNQSVNMTNNHASQGYSEARASRYLRKM